MSFLSPSFLWALPLVAVPLLIHLFGKRRREVIRWGAMEFLMGSLTPRRRLLRLRDLLLMLLRVAIVLVIIGALSQPVINSTHFGATGPRDIILVLDNSMSTSRKIGTETVFDLELAEAARLLKDLNTSDQIRVLLTSPRPEWLTTGPLPGDAHSVRSLLNQLKELRPNDAAADMLECVQRAIMADTADKGFSRFVCVISDGQAHGWRAETAGEWSSIQRLASGRPSPVLTRVVLATNPSAVLNLSMEKISMNRAVVGVGQPVTLTASVRNNGGSATDPASLTWRSGEYSLGVSPIPSLQPGAGTAVRLSQPFAMPGVVEVLCKLPGQDDLPADDSVSALLDVTRAVRVLIVEGEAKTDPVQSDIDYFLAALGHQRSTSEASVSVSAFEPKRIDYHKISLENLSDFQCVVLANVPRLAGDTVRKLVRYVNNGGGLWIALGEQTDIAAFNETFFEQSVGISPVSLGKVSVDERESGKFASLAPPAAEHPATALLSDLQRLDTDRVKIYKHHQFNSSVGSSVPVLLRGDGGMTLAVEKNLGRGRVIVQAFPLGLAWSNLPLCHSFVVLVHEWLWYLAEPSLVKRNLQPGEILQVNRLSGSDSTADLLTPAGWSAKLTGLEEDGRTVFRYSKTQLPGTYQFTIVGAGENAQKFVVSRDPEESNLTPLSAQQIDLLSKMGGLQFGNASLSVPAGKRLVEQKKAIGGWLLLALLLVLLLEAAAAFWLARNRQVALADLSVEPAFHA